MIVVSIRDWFFIDRLSTDYSGSQSKYDEINLALDNIQIDRFQFISLDLPWIQIVQTLRILVISYRLTNYYF
jgi:hypothetical protein